MNINITRAAALAAAGLLGLGMTACGTPGDEPDPAITTTVDEDWFAGDDEDRPDCDAEDRRANEVPDCGFIAGGRFVAWSWVTQGRQVAPLGWHAGPERRAASATQRPTQRPAGKTGTVSPKMTPTKKTTTSRRR